MGGSTSSLKISSDKKPLAKSMGPEADIADPKTSLTPREVAYVQQTWFPIKQDLKTYGHKFFLLLFQTYPEVQKRFEVFTGKSHDELQESKRLMGHGATVFSALDSYISNLNDIETVSEMLKTTGENHKSRGVEKSDFPLVTPVIIKVLREALGSAWTVEAEKSWEKLLKVVLSIIMSAFD